MNQNIGKGTKRNTPPPRFLDFFGEHESATRSTRDSPNFSSPRTNTQTHFQNPRPTPPPSPRPDFLKINALDPGARAKLVYIGGFWKRGEGCELRKHGIGGEGSKRCGGLGFVKLFWGRHGEIAGIFDSLRAHGIFHVPFQDSPLGRFWENLGCGFLFFRPLGFQDL